MSVSQITPVLGVTGRHRAPKHHTTAKRAATTALAVGLVGAPLSQAAPALAMAGGGASGTAESDTSSSGSGATTTRDGMRTYTVRSGDTLAAIADRFGVSWRTLYRLNGGIIDDPTLIFPGQRLKISGSSDGTTAQGAVAHTSTFGERALALAERLEGIPYVWGGETPATGFDCSGFTQYVYGQLGEQIPRTSGEQYAAATPVSRSEARPGDLVFFHSVSGVYHVAIYAGGGEIWQSPNPGESVELVEIWTSDITFGRF
ncbi:MAG: C40 family peptidase [Carbonactinosporaceae bacterium]